VFIRVLFTHDTAAVEICGTVSAVTSAHPSKAEIVSVNVGLPRTIATPRGDVETAIFKEPTTERLAVSQLNLEGDAQADLTVHGGANKAVYGYPVEHYEYWADALGRTDLTPGQFGENLTTRGLLEKEVLIGDVFSVGSATLEVSQPRSPCFKLGLRMGDPRFPKKFHKSGLSGFYFRVLETGEIGAGDELDRIERGRSGITVHEIWALSHGDASDPARLATALELDTLGPEWHTPMERKLRAYMTHPTSREANDE
jgi:MOSC domain-containing protein YiiM